MKIESIEWQQTCHGPLAELKVGTNWLRVERLESAYAITVFGIDKHLLKSRVLVGAEELQALLES